MKVLVIGVALAIAAGVVVLAIGMPCIFGCCKPSLERSASSTLKSVAMAQQDFRSNDRDANGVQDYWRADIAGLYTVKPKGSTDAIKLIELSCAGADDRPASDIAAYAPRAPKAGYWFRAISHEGEKTPDPNRFAAMSHPVEQRPGQRNTFIVCEDGAVRKFYFPRTGGVDLYPADPDKAGWSKLD
jgi:FAD/FMN-containing dehydrogenase